MIRIYRDVDTNGVLNTIQTIEREIGLMSPIMISLFDALKGSVKNLNLKEAIKLAKLISVAGKAGNVDKIKKTKLLARALEDRLRKHKQTKTVENKKEYDRFDIDQGFEKIRKQSEKINEIALKAIEEVKHAINVNEVNKIENDAMQKIYSTKSGVPGDLLLKVIEVYGKELGFDRNLGINTGESIVKTKINTLENAIAKRKKELSKTKSLFETSEPNTSLADKVLKKAGDDILEKCQKFNAKINNDLKKIVKKAETSTYKGFDPDIVLDKIPQSRNWYGELIKNLAETLRKNFASISIGRNLELEGGMIGKELERLRRSIGNLEKECVDAVDETRTTLENIKYGNH